MNFLLQQHQQDKQQKQNIQEEQRNPNKKVLQQLQ